MGRPRFVYYFRAIMLFFFSGVCFIMPIIPKVRQGGITFGIGIGLRLLAFVVGIINYYFAKNDSDIEKDKDKKIVQLEKKLNDLKRDKLKD